MYQTITNHIRQHKNVYGIGFVVLLFLTGYLLLAQVGGLNTLKDLMKGDIGRYSRSILKMPEPIGVKLNNRMPEPIGVMPEPESPRVSPEPIPPRLTPEPINVMPLPEPPRVMPEPTSVMPEPELRRP